MNDNMTPRPDCTSCRGRGWQDAGYTHGDRFCTACTGSGKEPRPEDEELLQMIDRMIRNRMEYGIR